MARVLICARCGTSEDVAIFALCPSCVHEVNVEDCAAQGLPAQVEDPEVLARIGRIVGRAEARSAS